MDTRQIANEAAEWLFKLEDDPAAEQSPEFVAWLKRSPRHMGEFLMATAALRLVQTGDPDKQLSVEGEAGREIGGEVLSLAQPGAPFGPRGEAQLVARNAVNVLAAAGTSEERDQASRASRPRSPRAFRTWAVAAGVLIVAGLVAWQLPRSAADVYSTRVGEQRSFKLADGSILYLNTRSTAQVRYSQQAREIRLTGGEALFVVAHDGHRPFRVQAGAATIQALGTQFNVYRRTDGVKVSVVEGRVKVSSRASEDAAHAGNGVRATAGSAELKAGEEAEVIRGQTIAKRPVRDLAPTLAWQQRRLVFEAMPLADVAREFNRYNHAQIEVRGASAQALQITGVFNADEPQALVNFLRDDPSLGIQTSDKGLVIASR